MPGCIGLHCGTTINLAQQYCVICMLNAGNMHMRKGSTGSESNALLKPFCRVNLAAAAVTSNKLRLHANAQSPVCTCLSGQPHSLHCCGICQAVQMYCCAKNFLGLRNIATTRNTAAIRTVRDPGPRRHSWNWRTAGLKCCLGIIIRVLQEHCSTDYAS